MKAPDRAWVVTVLMGLGHLRAAYPLRDLTHEGVVLHGSRRTTPGPEYRLCGRAARGNSAVVRRSAGIRPTAHVYEEPHDGDFDFVKIRYPYRVRFAATNFKRNADWLR